MSKKTSAHYQREFRRRMREQGLIKKEIWILPENAKKLTAIERLLRQTGDFSNQIKLLSEGEVIMENITLWTTQSLFKALSSEEIITSGRASIELIEGAEPSLMILMKEYGDLPVFVTVAGEQIIAESVLWPLSEVTDVAGFNEAVLRTHKYFPLSTISLDKVEDDEDYYHMFGALSSTSILPNIVFEIEVLASNVIQATEAYNEYLSVAVTEEV
ncbi:YjfI family protein [Hahella ganghwensis]|uniref:biofilm formation regulator BacA n=1 Tax=Hahella ganghwensis TaxID=286420 RepID=UPI000373AF1D|nr:YjfI family protein [Hahella ganghwensis]